MLYDKQGRLQALYDKYGQTVVQLHYDAAHTRRVCKVSRLFLSNNGEPAIERNELLVSYGYTDSGQLQEVLDATGQVVRNFGYTEEGYLKRHQLASGAVREYEWARYTIPENVLHQDGRTEHPIACRLCLSRNLTTNGGWFVTGVPTPRPSIRNA